MAESIYESAECYGKEKFLHAIKTRGGDRYNELEPRLGKITRDIVDLKNDTMVPSSIHRAPISRLK